MEKYNPRLTPPENTNKYYVSSQYNVYASGYNMFKMGGNCTTYCYGRWAELLDKKPNLCPNQAENWWRYKDGYERGQTPKLGAIAVWSQGSQFNPKDGYGHVAIVEQIFESGDFTASESGAKTYLFKTTKYKAPNYPRINSTFKFLGFIYLPIEFEEEQLKPIEPTTEYTKGNYITLEDMNIRSGAGYKYAIKKVKDMSENGKKHATSTNLNSNATYKKGTEFTALEIIKVGSKEYWAKTPSGYICLQGTSGKIYCKKAN